MASPVFAEDSTCGPAPSLPTTASSTESLKGQLQGQADFLSKLVGKAELAGQVEAARNSLYQSSDSFFAAQKDAYLAYLFCSIIMKDNTLTTSDKLKALQEFRKPVTSDHSDSSNSHQVDIAHNLAWNGGLYSGPIVDGKPNGKDGTLIYQTDANSVWVYHWKYQGSFVDGKRSGQGKLSITVQRDELADDMKTVVVLGSVNILLEGDFDDNRFLKGSGSIPYDKFNSFDLWTSKGSGNIAYGTYTGDLISKNPNDAWAVGSIWEDIVPDGTGEFVGSLLKEGKAEDYQMSWKGGWKEGALLGNGRVTYPDGGYEEGLFHYRELVEGKVIAKSSLYYWGVTLLPPVVYSGLIRNGVPNGEGEMSSDDFKLDVRLKGTFVDGNIYNGYGYKPMCAEQHGCGYGSSGEWRNGELFTGHESIPSEIGNGRVEVDEYEMKDGKMIKHTTRQDS
jgi:hypothetical protein